MIDQNELNQLKKYFADQPVDAVYLFGSQATGKANKLSDYDFGVLFEKGIDDSRRFDLRVRMITEVLGILKTDYVDMVDLQRAPLQFKYQIIFPKRVIFSKNKKRMTETEYQSVHSYLDFQPYLYKIAKRQLELMADRGFKK